MPRSCDTEKTRRACFAVHLAIVEATAEAGFPPTVREVAARTGYTSGRVSQVLPLLRDEGAVSWEPGRSRTLRSLRAP